MSALFPFVIFPFRLIFADAEFLPQDALKISRAVQHT